MGDITMDPLSSEAFGGLGLSDFLQNPSSSSSLNNNVLSSSDMISRFLQSSHADFSFGNVNSNDNTFGSSHAISKGVADEISQFLREKNEEGSSTLSPTLTPCDGLKWSAFLGKQQIGCFDEKKVEESAPKCDQIVPPNIQGLHISNDTESNEGGAVLGVERTPVLASIPTPSIPKRKTSIQVENIMLKKRKRQEKNREAAQLFRQRQKAKVVELEKKMEVLINISNGYRHTIEALFSENKMLAEQLIYWKNVVASGILITRMPGYAESPIETRQTFLEEFKKLTDSMPTPNRPSH